MAGELSDTIWWSMPFFSISETRSSPSSRICRSNRFQSAEPPTKPRESSSVSGRLQCSSSAIFPFIVILSFETDIEANGAVRQGPISRLWHVNVDLVHRRCGKCETRWTIASSPAAGKPGRLSEPRAPLLSAGNRCASGLGDALLEVWQRALSRKYDGD